MIQEFTRERGVASRFLLAIPLLVAFGCATPTPVLRLEPIGRGLSWSHGIPVQWAERDGIGVELQPDDSGSSRLIFHVTIVNRAEIPILVRPEDGFISGTSPAIQPAAAIDPEQLIRDLDFRLAELEAEEANRVGATLLVGFANLVADIAQPVTKVVSEPDTDSDEATAELAYESRKAALAAQRDTWAQGLLRRTTLAPGESVEGDVYFRRPASAQEWIVHIRGGWQEFEFRFVPSGLPEPTQTVSHWPRSAEAPMP